jgi:hypothetical protein
MLVICIPYILHMFYDLMLCFFCVYPPSQGSCTISIAQTIIMHFLKQLSIQAHKKFNKHHMFDLDEDIQQPNYREIIFGAISYHDVVNCVKPHLHNTLKLSANNPL